MNQKAKERLIFALDVDNYSAAKKLINELYNEVGMFKVGKQLFTRCGPEIVHLIKERGGEVFLDLKYHDIPNTVAMAVVEACKLGVAMVNVHALGGAEMMRRTVEEVDAWCAQSNEPRPLLLAVTILTSSTEETLAAVGIERSVDDMVLRLAQLAQDSGFDGVVASPREAAMIRAACGENFAIVTPGVRPAFATLDDQKRVTTPADAINAGATALVVGRPISAAEDRVHAAELIVGEIAAALEV